MELIRADYRQCRDQMALDSISCFVARLTSTHLHMKLASNCGWSECLASRRCVAGPDVRMFVQSQDVAAFEAKEVRERTENEMCWPWHL
jgi:hypothetical protein